MSIHLILGPMFAGKSTQLLRLAECNERAGLNVVYVKHQLDQKRHEDKIRTHNGELSPSTALISNELMDVYDHLTERWIDLIYIDEGQFFRDLAPIAQLLANKHGKRVVIAALNATYKRHMFPSVVDLLPFVEKVDWLTAVCFNCENNSAQFTHRLLPDTSNDNEYGDGLAVSCMMFIFHE